MVGPTALQQLTKISCVLPKESNDVSDLKAKIHLHVCSLIRACDICLMVVQTLLIVLGVLTTRQPLWVILCHLPGRGRKEIEAIVEMKERDRETEEQE